MVRIREQFDGDREEKMKINFKAIGLIASLTFLTNILGFVREVLFARAFGTTDVADAFITAFTIASAFFFIFLAGTVQPAFMPRYQELIAKRKEQSASLLFKKLFLILSVLFIGVIIVLQFSGSTLVDWVVPGFDPKKRELTTQILLWLTPIILFLGTCSLLQSVLHAHQRFFWPAIVPFLKNVVLILSIIFLVPVYGITGLAVGFILGSFLWWIMLVPPVIKVLPKSSAKGSNIAELKNVMLNLWPLLCLLTADQLSALIQKGLVSGLGTGYISALSYGAKIAGLPIGIFTMAVATVYFPSLVKAIHSKDKDQSKSEALNGLSAIGFLAIPATLFIMLYAPILVELFFQRGSFDVQATALTSHALTWYALGILPQSFIVFFNRIYFSAEQVKTPMKIGVLSAIIHIIFCYFSVGWIGYIGIAIGTTLYACVYCLLLYLRIGPVMPLNFSDLFSVNYRPVLASLLFIPISFLISVHSLMTVILVIIVSGVAYVGMLWLLRDPLLFSLFGYMKLRLTRS